MLISLQLHQPWVRIFRAYKTLENFCCAPSYIVYHILTTVIMLLFSATSSGQTSRQQSKTRFRGCIDALESLQITWPMARKSISLLRELARRLSVIFALSMRLSNVLDTYHCVLIQTYGWRSRNTGTRFPPRGPEEQPIHTYCGEWRQPGSTLFWRDPTTLGRYDFIRRYKY